MKRILRPLVLLPNPYLTAIQSAGKLFGMSSGIGMNPCSFSLQSHSKKGRPKG